MREHEYINTCIHTHRKFYFAIEAKKLYIINVSSTFLTGDRDTVKDVTSYEDAIYACGKLCGFLQNNYI